MVPPIASDSACALGVGRLYTVQSWCATALGCARSGRFDLVSEGCWDGGEGIPWIAYRQFAGDSVLSVVCWFLGATTYFRMIYDRVGLDRTRPELVGLGRSIEAGRRTAWAGPAWSFSITPYDDPCWRDGRASRRPRFAQKQIAAVFHRGRICSQSTVNHGRAVVNAYFRFSGILYFVLFIPHQQMPPRSQQTRRPLALQTYPEAQIPRKRPPQW